MLSRLWLGIMWSHILGTLESVRPNIPPPSPRDMIPPSSFLGSGTEVYLVKLLQADAGRYPYIPRDHVSAQFPELSGRGKRGHCVIAETRGAKSEGRFPSGGPQLLLMPFLWAWGGVCFSCEGTRRQVGEHLWASLPQHVFLFLGPFHKWWWP